MEEWLVCAVMATYEGAQRVVRTVEGDSEAFNVKVGLHQGPVLTAESLLFVILIEVSQRSYELNCRGSYCMQLI